MSDTPNRSSMIITWLDHNSSLNVIRWSIMVPSDFSVVATGSAAPATSTESIEVAERSWLAVPSTMACDLSAFNSKLFDRYQPRTAVEHNLSTSNSCAESLARMDRYSWVSSAYCWCLTPKLSILHSPLVTRRRRIIGVPARNLAVRRNYSRTDQTSVGRSSHIVGDRTGSGHT